MRQPRAARSSPPLAGSLSHRRRAPRPAATPVAKNGQRPLPLAEIAAVEHLPLPYLEQLVSPLRRVGLIEGMRGLHGGYRLTRAPSAISIFEIVRVLEGPDATAPVDCVAPSYVAGSCPREGECPSRPLWTRVEAAIDAVLDTTTLCDLLRAPRPGSVTDTRQRHPAARRRSLRIVR